MEVPKIKGEQKNKSLDQHSWRGGRRLQQFGASLIDVGARTQTAIVIQMEQNRGEQINPRLIAPSWAVTVWECVWVCIYFRCVFVSARRCTTLQATGKRAQSAANWPPTLSVVGCPLISRSTHTHAHTGFGDELLIGIGRHRASERCLLKRCSSLLPVSVSLQI